MNQPHLLPTRLGVSHLLRVGLLLVICSTPTENVFAQDSIPGQAPAPVDTSATLDSAAAQTAAAQDSARTQALLLQQRAEALADTMDALWLEIDTLYRHFTEAQGEERLILDGLVERRVVILRPQLGRLTALVVSIDSLGGDASGPRVVALTMLDNARRLVRDEVREIYQDMVVGRADRSITPVEELLDLERELTQAGVELDTHLRSLLNIAGFKTALGAPVQDDHDLVDPLILARSDRLTAEIEVTARAVKDLVDRLAGADDETDARMLRLELSATQERLHAATSSLTMVVDMMDRRGMETAEQKSLIIQTTGRVTTDVLNIEVATGLLRQAWNSGRNWVSERAPQFLFNSLMFVFILIVFRLLSKLTRRVATRAFNRSTTKVPALLKQVGVSMMANAVFLLGILIGLSQMGIHVGPVLAGLGVAGFIVGFALQDSLSNFASGMMILVYRPFDVGDVIEAAGVSGTVDNLSLVSTTILTFDNQRLSVPNRQVWGNVIRNKTSEPIRRVDLVFDVGQRSDVPRADALFQTILNDHPLVRKDPEPVIRVDELNDSSVRMLVRPWVNTPDYWDVYWGLTRIVNDRLEAEGIAPPTPKREVVSP